MDSGLKSEIISNVKVLYDQTTGAQLEIEKEAQKENSNFKPQPKFTGPGKVSRHDFLEDLAVGGVKVLRRLIIKERARMESKAAKGIRLTSASDLPFTQKDWKYNGSVFDKWQQKYSPNTYTRYKPQTTKRGALRNSSNYSRTCVFNKNKNKDKK